MDKTYKFDVDKVQAAREKDRALVRADPKFIRRVKVAPSALMKMMMHAQSGVEKGRAAARGMPVEIMGKLVGVPDENDEHCIIVLDAKPINAEGFETNVQLQQKDFEYDVQSNDFKDPFRNEREVGWYHSHPFDAEAGKVNTFFSATDVLNQEQNQYHFPYCGIVIDPITSTALGKPVIEAFARYWDNSDNLREMPDGTPVRFREGVMDKVDRDTAEQRWANSWSKYYRLDLSYFSSSLTRRTISSIQNVFMHETTISKKDEADEAGIIGKEEHAVRLMRGLNSNVSSRPQLSTIAKSTGSLGASQALLSYGQLVRKSLVDNQ